MNVLITNVQIAVPSGTEVYVRDLAIALKKRGISVEVYSSTLGPLAEEIRVWGINVVNSTAALENEPDIIHAHHFVPAVDAILRFNDVPVIYFLHDRLHVQDDPPRHSQVMKYLAVDYNCLDRLVIDNEIPEEDTAVVYNWVDTDRFKLRKAFAKKASRALVFSNNAYEDNYFKIIKEACEAEGLAVDGVGALLGNIELRPEDILGNYDIVFAKAKAAMEAMATGANVIVCDAVGLGESVTAANFDHFRKFNFGMKTMTRPVEKKTIIEEIRKYSVPETQRVAHLIRDAASLTRSVDRLLDLYSETIERYKNQGPRPSGHDKDTIRHHFVLKNLQPIPNKKGFTGTRIQRAISAFFRQKKA